METADGTAMNSGMMWWEMASLFQRQMQRASLQSLSVSSRRGRVPAWMTGTSPVMTVGAKTPWIAHDRHFQTDPHRGSRPG